MKRTMTTIFILLSAGVLISSCKKSNNNPTKSKTQLLTQGAWYLTKYEQKTNNGNWIDNYITIPNCGRDNFTTFQTNGTQIVDEGATKCSAGDPQTNSATWAFTDNETRIAITTNVTWTWNID